MIDWLSSKFAMAVAVIVLTASTVGFFAYQRSQQFERDVEGCAGSMARYIESFASLTGETRAVLTFGQGVGMDIPPAIQGKAVSVNVSNSLVIVACGNSKAAEGFAAKIHIWRPPDGELNKTAVEKLDTDNPWTGEIKSPGGLTLEKKIVELNGRQELLTFCYASA